MRRRGQGMGILVGAAITLMALTVAAIAPASSSPRSEAANKRAARKDAAHLLSLLKLPPGASYSATQPPGTPLALALPLITQAGVQRTSWWLVPGSPQDILDWVGANPPSGSKLTHRGPYMNLNGTALAWYSRFDWRPVPGVLGSRSLQVTVAATSDTTTELRADTAVSWAGPSRIPATARIVDVVVAREGGERSKPAVIAKPRAVRGLAKLIDGLPTYDSTNAACVVLPQAANTVHLIFRASRGGRILAEATQGLPASSDCNPLKLTIWDRPQRLREDGGRVLRKVRALLGGRL